MLLRLPNGTISYGLYGDPEVDSKTRLGPGETIINSTASEARQEAQSWRIKLGESDADTKLVYFCGHVKVPG